MLDADRLGPHHLVLIPVGHDRHFQFGRADFGDMRAQLSHVERGAGLAHLTERWPRQDVAFSQALHDLLLGRHCHTGSLVQLMCQGNGPKQKLRRMLVRFLRHDGEGQTSDQGQIQLGTVGGVCLAVRAE